MNRLRNLLQHDPAATLRTAQQHDANNEALPGETAFIIGAALYALARVDEAEVSLRAALRKNPAHRLAGTTLARLLRDQGRYRAAADTVEALIAAVPGDRDFAFHAIGFLRDSRQLLIAERIWKSTQPNPGAEASCLGGEVAMMLGDFATARERLDRCLKLDPIHPGALQARSNIGPLSAQDTFAAHLERLAHGRLRLPEASRVMLDFALGKLAMERGELAAAFAHYDRANVGQGTLTPWDTAGAVPSSHATSQSQRKDSSDAQRGADVVLIIGLPRSGTTLLASRLGQHPDIADRGELPWLGMVGGSPMTADAYLRYLHEDDAPRVRYMDKNPLNFQHLDFVAREFPHARILHCRRDPRDVAVSCYTQYFPHPDMAWSQSWDGIIEFQGRYRGLIEQRPQGMAWLDIDYAEMIAAPETVLRRATDFLELEWDARVLDVSAGGSIGTGSLWQARQPMHARSLERWRECAPYIAPLLAAYGDQPEPAGWFRRPASST